ncbi:hypothetical protein FSOLCH5_013731 [Fusarium solani]|uniref:Fucose-specific lectin n=2 Tax=Fusarium solani TaxID=169388 RepID=A0A9P9H986_FUSSL|nr:uncharacterized protein B0J15DRAFT_398034 [Fusarium solani]KAH7252875.1 hypothetical protein B0J15DRAFT_398034 [Fusarium solani]KAJ4201112.1 hypothetical protein NW759_015715 [Fusarium solani]
MTDTLQDVTAVVTEVSNQDIVFHVTRDFKISYWSSKTSDETQGEQYNSENLKINGNPVIVNSKLPILAAVAYKNPNTKEDEVRVYYVGEKSLTLREIRRTGKGKWYDGQVFNQQSYDIAENSGLTANVVAVNKGSCEDNPRKEWQLKVYYQRKADILNVVYNVLNQSGENWSTRYGVNE